MAGMIGYGIWRLFDLRFASGDIYPPYSSLRADAQGTRAVFDSLSELSGYAVNRNFRPFESMLKGKQTVFYLGITPRSFELATDDELKSFEELAESGSRVVIGFLRARRERALSGTSLSKRWHVSFAYLNRIEPGDDSGTSLVFIDRGPEWHGSDVLERNFGAGSIVLLPFVDPLSNQALELERNTPLITSLIGSNRKIVFEESHLGVIESGSVAGLARKYRLQGLYAAVLLLAALFVWKNSTSLLPPLAASPTQNVASAKDQSSGLANLLRRNIPQKDLIGVCLEQWEKSRVRYSNEKRLQVRAVARRGGDPVIMYQEIGRILAQRD